MKIISGFQTGADIAGIDVAITLNIPYGGHCPKGRKWELGVIPEKYNPVEDDSEDYRSRTLKNIINSDVTLIFTVGKLDGGSKLTLDKATELGKPARHFNLSSMSNSQASAEVSKFIEKYKPAILNIAGNRESKSPGIHKRVSLILLESFRCLPS